MIKYCFCVFIGRMFGAFESTLSQSAVRVEWQWITVTPLSPHPLSEHQRRIFLFQTKQRETLELPDASIICSPHYCEHLGVHWPVVYCILCLLLWCRYNNLCLHPLLVSLSLYHLMLFPVCFICLSHSQHLFLKAVSP